MKNIFPDILKIAYKNNIIKPFRGAISYKEENNKLFYINGNNVINSNSKPDIHRINIEREYFELNYITKNRVTKDIDLHGINMIKNFSEGIVLIQPDPEYLINFTKKNFDVEIINFENKVLYKTKIEDSLDFINSIIH